MAYNDFTTGSKGMADMPDFENLILKANGPDIQLPDASYIKDAQIMRDGMDLVLKTANNAVTIDNYFSAEQTPTLSSPDGTTLTPKLVKAFVTSAPQYAQLDSMTDASHVGSVQEISGSATITRINGSTETVTTGTKIYNGDIIETSESGAVNISFIDESSFAVSENARLAIDEYVYDPASESGATDFSVLKGMFVYTSGLIGRDDPDDVTIDTPSGSIGIRGTIIAGDVNSGEITVVEGAIVLRDFSGNEVTLATQFETAKFDTSGTGQGIHSMGQISASDVAAKFSSISGVSPSLFSSINDAAAEQNTNPETNGNTTGNEVSPTSETSGENSENQTSGNSDAEASTDGESNSPAAETEGQNESKESNTPDKSDSNSGAEPQTEAKAANTANSNSGADTNSNAKAAGANAGNGKGTAEAKAFTASFQGLDSGINAHKSGSLGTGQKQNSVQESINNILSQNNNSNSANQRLVDTISHRAPNPAEQAVFLTNSDNLADTSSNVENGLTDITDDQRPVFTIENVAPGLTQNKLFAAVEGDEQWAVRFDQLFTDADTPHEELTYELHQDTVNRLNQLRDGPEGVLESWNFNQDTGKLIFNFQNANDPTADPAGMDISFAIKIRAIDGGETGGLFDDYGYEHFNFTAYSADYVAPSSSGTASVHTAIGSYKEYFVQYANTTTVSGNKVGAIVAVADGYSGDAIFEKITLDGLKNATLYAGEGSKDVVINGSSDHNTIIGGNSAQSHDYFTINNADNHVYGMDGNDTFKLVLGTQLNNSLTNTGADYHMDGGQNGMTYAQAAITGNSAGGDQAMGVTKGDTINLFNNTGTYQTLDFSALSNTKFTNFENIQLQGGNTTIKLSMEDIFNMTDGHNVLTIFAESGNDYVVDLDVDPAQGQSVTINDESYTSYTGTHNGETLTILVEADPQISVI